MTKLFRLLRHDWPMHFVLLITNWLPDNVALLRLRGMLASPFLGSCKGKLKLGRNITFYNPSKINVGKDVYIALGNWFSAVEAITIGDEVLFGPYNVTTDSSHTQGRNGSFRHGKPESAPIIIGHGVWITSHCTLTAGVDIGEGSVVGAQTVVRGKVPPHVLFAGIPGKVIKHLQQ